MCLLLAACGTRGLQLAEEKQRVTDVPAIGPGFPPIPLRVAVYLTPQVLASGTIYDQRSNSSYPYVIDYGRTGPAIAVSVARVFPAAFNEVYLVSGFPDARLADQGIDAVVVLENAAGSSWYKPGSGMGWDNQLQIGVYRPDGEPIARYSVVATSVPDMPIFNGPTPAWVSWASQRTQEAVDPAVRLALHRFPRRQVLDDLAANKAATRETLASMRNDAAYWQLRRARIEVQIESGKPKLPEPTITIDEYSRIAQGRQASAMALGMQLNSQMAAQNYARNPTAFSQRMMSLGVMNQAVMQIYAQQLQAGQSGQQPDQTPLVMQFIGGLDAAMRTAADSKGSRLKLADAALQMAAATDPANRDVYEEVRKTASLIDSLSNGGPPAARSAVSGGGECLGDLRRARQELLARARQSGANAEQLRSLGSGTVVVAPSACSTPVPSALNQSQSQLEARRVYLCGAQTVNCAIVQVEAGTECRMAVSNCQRQHLVPSAAR